MNVLERYKKPTPAFFKRLRNIGITLATVGGTIYAAPIAMPDLLVNIAGYLTVAGTVAVTVSQAAVQEGETLKAEEDVLSDDGP